MPNHIGLSGKEHWVYSEQENTLESCPTCRKYKRAHALDATDFAEEYGKLPEILTGAELKDASRIIKKAVGFTLNGGYYQPLVFGTVPPPFTVFKVVDRAMSPSHGGRNHKFDEPKNGQPGAWSVIPDNQTIEFCVRGFHFTDLTYLDNWASGNGYRVFRAEVEGPWMGGTDKFVARKLRLIEEVDYRAITKLAKKIPNPNQAPDVTDMEALAIMKELTVKLWFPEKIKSTDPLMVELREAAEAEDVERYEEAQRAIHSERTVIDHEIAIAQIRNKPTNVLDRRRRGLEIPAGVRVGNYDVSNAIADAAEKVYPGNNMLQRLETERLAGILRVSRSTVQIDKIVNAKPSEAIAELTKMGIVPAPRW